MEWCYIKRFRLWILLIESPERNAIKECETNHKSKRDNIDNAEARPTQTPFWLLQIPNLTNKVKPQYD